MATADNTPAFSGGDVVFESLLVMDEPLLRELVSAKDRSMNKRDGLVMCAVWAVVLVAYIWGTVSVGVMTAWGVIAGVIVVALLGWSVALAVTGFTLFWPKRSWRKTADHWFGRHGVGAGDDQRCELRSSACLSEARCCVMKEGRPAGSVAKPYKASSHVEETEHLVVLVATDGEVGSVLHNMFSPSYADKLAGRADLEDICWDKRTLAGGTPEQLVEYLQRKLGAR